MSWLQLFLLLLDGLHQPQDVHFTADVLAEPSLGGVELVEATLVEVFGESLVEYDVNEFVERGGDGDGATVLETGVSVIAFGQVDLSDEVLLGWKR